MTLAADARDAARAHPFVHAGLRAGVINHTAAARYLGADEGEIEAVAAALRRYAEELSEREPPGAPDARVDMRGGLGAVDDPGEALLVVGDVALAPGAGDLTGLLARGPFGPRALGAVLARLDAEGVAVTAAGAADGLLVTVVDRADGVDALRYVEDALRPA